MARIELFVSNRGELIARDPRGDRTAVVDEGFTVRSEAYPEGFILWESKLVLCDGLYPEYHFVTDLAEVADMLARLKKYREWMGSHIMSPTLDELRAYIRKEEDRAAKADCASKGQAEDPHAG